MSMVEEIPDFTDEEKKILLRIARSTIEEKLRTGKTLTLDLMTLPPRLREPGASFVTLEKHGALRGCIGSVEAYRPLAEDVRDNAIKAAFSDPRFPPLSSSELKDLEIEVSVLTKPVPLMYRDVNDLLRQIQPGVDGLILEYGYFRGLFLPQVWEQLPTKEEFMAHLSLKAGLPPDAYRYPGVTIKRFHVIAFKESEVFGD
jgi:AmmeMemoRadiSam system protein A